MVGMSFRHRFSNEVSFSHDAESVMMLRVSDNIKVSNDIINRVYNDVNAHNNSSISINISVSCMQAHYRTIY